MIGLSSFRGLDDLADLIIFEFFKNFAISMLGIFIPIMIYSETSSLLLPAYYLLFRGIAGMVASIPVMKIINSFGFKSGLTFSYVFLLPAILLIYFFKPDIVIVLLVAFLYSIGSSFHNQSMNLEFAESSSKENRDMNAAHLMSLPNLGRLFGPLVGGVASTIGGFQAMLVIAFSSILISTIPARAIMLKKKTSGLNIKSVFKKKLLSYSPIFISRGIQGYASVAIFSLFTYIFVAGSISSGAVRSFDIVGFMIMAYISGWTSSKYSRSKIMAVGASLAGIIYLLRIGVSSPLEAFAVSVAGGLAFKLYDIPLFSKLADGAQNSEERAFYASKKLFNSLGKVIAAATLITALILYGEKTAFSAIFVLAAVSTLTMMIGNRIVGDEK